MRDRFESRKILNALPGSVMRDIMTRKLARLDLDLPGVNFRVASTVDDYEGAIRLVNACYIRRGILNPDAVHIPISLFSPQTVLLVAEKDSQIIGTVTVIGETPFGFPMEAIHGPEIASLRTQGHSMVEIGSLSVLESFRNTGVFLMLSSMLYRYVRNLSGARTAVMASHPSTECFYSGIFLFDKIGPIQRYTHFANAQSVPFMLDLAAKNDEMRAHYERIPLRSEHYETLYSLYCPQVEDGLFSYGFRHGKTSLSPAQIRELYGRFSLDPATLSSRERNMLEIINPEILAEVDMHVVV